MLLVFLIGGSGAGKGTIKNMLIKQFDYIISMPSYTSRLPRPGDISGKDYFFISDEEFEKMIKNDEFYEYSKHHNHYYGTSKKFLQEKLKSGKVIIRDMDVNGAENLVKLLGNDIQVITIFLKVPKEELIKRLLNREDHPSQSEIDLRLSRLEYEESKIGSFDYVIKNNNLDKTIQIIIKIIEQERLNKNNLEF